MRVSSLLAVVSLAGCANDIQVAQKANVAPAASIQSPTDGTAVTAGVNVSFVGTIADGDGLDDVQTVSWLSSLDGEIVVNGVAVPDASGTTRVSTVLSPGSHAITLRAVDASGEIGEATISVSVGDAVVAPTIEILEPVLFADFYLGQVVDLLVTVDDDQDEPSTLFVTWSAENQDTGSVTPIADSTPNGSGLATGSWMPSEVGGYVLTATVEDPDGNQSSASVAIDVNDQDGADLDGDGFSYNSGDCDDSNAQIGPNSPEICGDAIDNDCSGVVDDKDEDNDQHIDEACVNYPGALPRDDCDDTTSQVYAGAGELADGIDNDCDGFIDEDTPAFDDDGDCFCEEGPCVDSVNASCTTLDEGDCEDGDDLIFPGAGDQPDLLFLDEDCDGIDGAEGEMVFLDPINGQSGNSGLLRTAPVRTWAAAVSAAQSNNRSWVAVSEGEVDMRSGSTSFVQGLSIAGGYDATVDWDRGASAAPRFEVSAAGEPISSWSTPTEFQYIDIVADDGAGTGVSSIALRIDNVDGLLFSSVVVIAGAAGNGSNGASVGGVGPSGSNGNNGSSRTGGSGGATCGGGASGGGGGTGGNASCGVFSCDEDPGTSGATAFGGGAGGGGGNAGGSNGGVGSRGANGAPGGNGQGGSALGSVSFGFGYVPSNGFNGGSGPSGSPGGGGGGGGGEGDWPDAADGGGGGGGGGGGCGGQGGGAGTGGGASIGIILDDSSLLMESSQVIAGPGGDGGSGGSGQTGGSGGNGGLGDPGEGSFGGVSNGGDGGAGGGGGDGGTGGAGGGGGGGPSIAVACVGVSVLNESQTVLSPGQGGAGGSSAGAPGALGLSAATNGCL